MATLATGLRCGKGGTRMACLAADIAVRAIEHEARAEVIEGLVLSTGRLRDADNEQQDA